MKLLVFVLALTLAPGVESVRAQVRPETPTRQSSLRHDSAFRDYRPFEEAKLRSWKESNQQVSPAPADSRIAPGKPDETGATQPRQSDAAKEKRHGH